jgi:hypothetical protein
MAQWLETVSIISLAAGFASSLIIILDIAAGHRQYMKIMNIVWPVTALYSGPLGLWAYYKMGRLSTSRRVREAKAHGEVPPGKRKPFWQSVMAGATHCGSGCTLGDIVAEWFVFFVPLTLFGERVFAAWAIDYVLAFLFGIAFQYFTIRPARKLSPRAGLVAAVKADTLSLTAWQVGMYGWMAVAIFVIFGRDIPKTNPVFWFMMQLAMLAGLLTSYPVNWLLLRKGIKEAM